jgi:hypothetical protein
MTTLDQTAFKQLDADKRLQNPVFKAATGETGRFEFVAKSPSSSRSSTQTKRARPN